MQDLAFPLLCPQKMLGFVTVMAWKDFQFSCMDQIQCSSCFTLSKWCLKKENKQMSYTDFTLSSLCISGETKFILEERYTMERMGKRIVQ